MLQALLKAKSLSAREIVEECLAKIAAYDLKGPCLNAIIRLNAEAVLQAGKLDRATASGKCAGVLHGIPLLVKDNIDEAGVPNTAGSVCLTGNIPQRDSFLIARLRAAGAIILGRANLHEFAIWGETVSSLQGQTLNPYDLTRSPGGSSGGTGAGVAAGYAAAGIGTDTVNSVRSPASANSLVGLRPTLGLISRTGIIPYSLTQDTAGPITTSVSDAALLLDVLAGADAADPVTAKSRGKIPRTYTAALQADGLRGKRIGVLRSFFGRETVHSAVNALLENALSAMRRAGAEILDVEEVIDADYLTSQLSVHLYDLAPDLDSYLRRMAPELPVHSLGEILASGRFHPGVGENIRQAVALERNSAAYEQRLKAQSELKASLLKTMGTKSLSALVYPHQRRPVAKVGDRQLERNGVLASVTGFPAIVVPGGFTGPELTAPLGVPVGIEFLGRPWEEETLLAIAYGFEKSCPLRKIPVL